VEEIIRVMDERLKEQLKKIKKKLRKKTIYLAVDVHNEPYYGKKQQWIVGRRKQSTNNFTRIMAMYLVHPRKTNMLAASAQKETEDETARIMIKDMLSFFSKEQWKIKKINILADGKYYLYNFLQFLQSENIDYFIRAYSSKK